MNKEMVDKTTGKEQEKERLEKRKTKDFLVMTRQTVGRRQKSTSHVPPSHLFSTTLVALMSRSILS
jgi:hypothetical protein